MIVHPEPGKKKKLGCAIKKRSAEYRAKETLKIAIANGTIRQLLWNEITLSASESSDDDKSEESPEFDQSSDWNNMLQRKPLVSVGSRSTVLNGNVLQKPSSPVPSGRRSINRSKTGLSEVNTKEIKKRFSRKEEQSQAEELEDLERESSEGQIFKRQYVRPKSFVDIMRKLKEGVQEAKTVMLGEVAEDSEQGSHDDEGSHSEGCDPAAQDDLNGWKEGDISNVHVELNIKHDNDVLWGGVVGKAHQSKENGTNDVLSDLFAVSNQLRTERETKLLQSYLANEVPAEIHLTSANYNDAIEDARQRKLADMYQVRQIAMLKLRSHAEHHRTHHQSNTVDFATFWAKLLEENEKFNSASLYDTFFAPMVVEQEEGAPVAPNALSLNAPARRWSGGHSDSNSTRNVDIGGGGGVVVGGGGGEGGGGGLHGWEDALQDELSMLFATKTKLAKSFAANIDGNHHTVEESGIGAPRNLVQTMNRLHALGVVSDETYRHSHGTEDIPLKDVSDDWRPRTSTQVYVDEVNAVSGGGEGLENAAVAVQRKMHKKHRHHHRKKSQHRHHNHLHEDESKDIRRHHHRYKEESKLGHHYHHSEDYKHHRHHRYEDESEHEHQRHHNHNHHHHSSSEVTGTVDRVGKFVQDVPHEPSKHKPHRPRHAKHPVAISKEPVSDVKPAADLAPEDLSLALSTPALTLQNQKHVHRDRQNHTVLRLPTVDIQCDSQCSDAATIRHHPAGVLKRGVGESTTGAGQAPHTPRSLDGVGSDIDDSSGGSDSRSRSSSDGDSSWDSYSSYSSAEAREGGEIYLEQAGVSNEDHRNGSSYFDGAWSGPVKYPPQIKKGHRYFGRTNQRLPTPSLHPVVGHALLLGSAGKDVHKKRGRPIMMGELEHLRGIWPYDTSLGAFNEVLRFVRAEQAELTKFRQARARVLAERRLALRNQELHERTPFPIHTNVSQEQKMLTFDTERLCLVLSTSRGGEVSSMVEVDIKTVFITQSVVPDMITLRTNDATAVPHGYLATYSVSQWNKMEHDINCALAEDAVAPAGPALDLTSSVLSLLENSSHLTLDSSNIATPSATQPPPPSAQVEGDTQFPSVSMPAFLTDFGLESAEPTSTTRFRPGGTMEHDLGDLSGVGDLGATPLPHPYQHYADLGYAAFQQILALNQISSERQTGVVADPRPPKCLQIPRVFAAEGPPRPLIVNAHPRRSRRKGKSRHHDSNILHSQFSSCTEKPAEQQPPSRYMDMIKGVVEKIKTERAELRRKAAELADLLSRTAALPPTHSPAASDSPRKLTLTQEEWKKMRFYDPYFQHSSVQELGYQAAGYVARGDEVNIAINGVAPYASGEASFASPTIPRQPRQLPPRARSFSTVGTVGRVSPAKSRFLRMASARQRHPHQDHAGTNSLTNNALQAQPATAESVADEGQDVDRNGNQGELPAAANRVATTTPNCAPSIKADVGTATTPPLSGSEHPHSSNSPAAAPAVAAPSRQLVQMQHYDATAMEAEMNNELQIVMLVESRKIMQLYFAKKFLQMDMVVDVLPTPMDAATTFRENYSVYGLVLLNFVDLLPSGVERSLREIIPGDLERGRYSLVVYNTGNASDADFETLERAGVADVLEEPYSLEVLKGVVLAHRRRRAMFTRYGHDTGWQA